jgi:cytoskeleton protein RodZ
MSDAPSSSVGETLRRAREAQGLSVDEVAQRLRLMHRQIEAMEGDAFDSLGQPVFARGFVRSYARLLGIAPEPLLASMGGSTSEPVVVSREEPAPARSWLSSPWLLIVMAAALLLAVLPIALYWWLNSEEPPAERPAAALPASRHAAAVTTPPLPPAATVLPAPAAQPPEATAPLAAADEVAAAVEQPVAAGVIQLDFGGESWVEIKDASGRMLHRQLNRAGDSAEIRGQPPFDVVVGNAAQARMSYNGRPIDLKPFIDVTVARFTLEE